MAQAVGVRRVRDAPTFMSAYFPYGAKASDQMSPYDDGVGDGVTLRHWSSILSFCTVAVVAGLVAGLFGALFRLALGWADGARIALVEFAHQALPAGWLVAVALGAATAAAAAMLARRFAPATAAGALAAAPSAGSGPQVLTRFSALPVNFVGGVLAVGGGLVMGPETPLIQMGEIIGRWVAKAKDMSTEEMMILSCAVGGAGLATAFNAPLGCSVYVLEALIKRLTLRTTLAALGAGSAAIGVSRLLLGSEPNFEVAGLQYTSFGGVAVHVVFGGLVGLLGAAYSWTMAKAVAIGSRLAPTSLELRAAVIGGGVGLVGWFVPSILGTGDSLTQGVLRGLYAPGALVIILVARFLLAPVSLAAATPGGLFSPILLLGAATGGAIGTAVTMALPELGITSTSLAVAGMAAFLAAAIRVPVTAALIAVEATGGFTDFLPIVATVFGATAVVTLLGSPSIDERLKELRASRSSETTGGASSDRSD